VLLLLLLLLLLPAVRSRPAVTPAQKERRKALMQRMRRVRRGCCPGWNQQQRAGR
jgi:hypothetical protein